MAPLSPAPKLWKKVGIGTLASVHERNARNSSFGGRRGLDLTFDARRAFRVERFRARVALPARAENKTTRSKHAFFEQSRVQKASDLPTD